LLNQVHLLQKAGSMTLQVLMITPSAGSRIYEETFRSGQVLDSAGGRKLEASMFDGNYVIATRDPNPWRKQVNILIAYLLFYNPVCLLWKLLSWRDRQFLPNLCAQIWGIWGLAHNLRRTLGWALRLLLGSVRRRYEPLRTRLPMRAVDGGEASHSFGRHSPPERTESSATDAVKT
jgi:hypothetical protein